MDMIDVKEIQELSTAGAKNIGGENAFRVSYLFSRRFQDIERLTLLCMRSFDLDPVLGCMEYSFSFGNSALQRTYGSESHITVLKLHVAC